MITRLSGDGHGVAVSLNHGSGKAETTIGGDSEIVSSIVLQYQAATGHARYSAAYGIATIA
ncbi:MAG: hypothetical protein AB2821_14570 [Candidatus Thiodiazotropha endolucinida]